MKWIVFVIAALHGLIHLLGFVKGFQLAEIQNLQSPISKTTGFFWLLAFVLFVVAGVLVLINKSIWMYLAGAALIISSILIVQQWHDAKIGMIPNMIILFALLVSLSGCAFNKKIARETHGILANTNNTFSREVGVEDLSETPDAVKKWLTSAGAIGKTIPNTVYLRQNFKMKLKPEQKDWHQATAEQYFTIENPAFIWTVELKMSPFIQIRGRDKFVEGKGEMQMKMNSIINLGKETGEKMDEGTLQRYLSEMVWFPSAAIMPYITWEEVDSLTAKATMNYQDTTGSGIFYFNEEGDFTKFSTMRYMGNDSNAQRYEWVITVDDYAEFEGLKIPSKCRATWKLDEGDWTWCIIEIMDLSYNKNNLDEHI